SMQRTSASVVVMVMMNSGLVIQEILQQGVAVFAQYGFRVELDAVHGQCLVAQAHDLAVIRFRSDFQAVRQSVARHGQGMVAGDGEWRRQSGEDVRSPMGDGGNLAMHDLAGPNYITAV